MGNAPPAIRRPGVLRELGVLTRWRRRLVCVIVGHRPIWVIDRVQPRWFTVLPPYEGEVWASVQESHGECLRCRTRLD